MPVTFTGRCPLCLRVTRPVLLRPRFSSCPSWPGIGLPGRLRWTTPVALPTKNNTANLLQSKTLLTEPIAAQQSMSHQLVGRDVDVKVIDFRTRQQLLILPIPKGCGGFRVGWGDEVISGSAAMTYTFKLSRRLARLRDATVIAASLFTLSCSDGPSGPGSTPLGTDPTSVVIAPDSISVGANQTVQFQAATDASGALSFNLASRKGGGRKKVVDVALSPVSSSIVPGGSLSFNATTTLNDGSISQPSVAWTATGGTVDTSGRYTAGKVTGKYRVIATASNGAADTATVSISTIAPILAQIVLSPASLSLPAGGSQQFTAEGKSADSATVSVTPAYTATGGTISPAGIYTAGQIPGTFLVIATDTATGVADTAGVTIPAPGVTLQSVVLTPATASVAQGAKQQFSASGKMSDGSTVPLSPSFSATGGSMSSSGEYTAGSTAGTYRVIATDTVSGNADTSSVTITAPPATLQAVVLTPTTISLTAGAKQQFSASGKMSDGSTVPLSPSFSATGGSMSSSGEYTAGSTAGTYRVIATDTVSGNADTSSVTITAPPATLQAVVLTPTTISLTAGATQQFTASGKMSDGSTSAVTVAWAAGGGTISSTGLYTAGQTAGTFRVIAAQSGGSLADTAAVTVDAPTTPPPPLASCARTVNASTLSGLTSALAGALPGDCISLAPGTYTLTAHLTINRSGTASQPIVIQGTGSNTIISGNGPYNVFPQASYLKIRKIRFTNLGVQGLWLRGATYNVLDSLEIDHTQQVGMALKDASHHNVIKNSRFHDIGTVKPYYGEAVYIGNSGNTGSPLQFTNTDNQILDNHFGPNVGAQALDLKAGSDRTIFKGNYVDGTGTQWAPTYGSATLISVISSHNTIEDNTLRYGSPNGITFYAPTTVTMSGNVVSNNRIDLGNIHNVTDRLFYGINLTVNTNQAGRVAVKCNNTVTNGRFSNVTCTP